MIQNSQSSTNVALARVFGHYYTSRQYAELHRHPLTHTHTHATKPLWWDSDATKLATLHGHGLARSEALFVFQTNRVNNTLEPDPHGCAQRYITVQCIAYIRLLHSPEYYCMDRVARLSVMARLYKANSSQLAIAFIPSRQYAELHTHTQPFSISHWSYAVHIRR